MSHTSKPKTDGNTTASFDISMKAGNMQCHAKGILEGQDLVKLVWKFHPLGAVWQKKKNPEEWQ
jgi:hypothetical protein